MPSQRPEMDCVREKPTLAQGDYKGPKDNNLLWDYDSPRYAQDFWAYNNVIRDPRDPDRSGATRHSECG